MMKRIYSKWHIMWVLVIATALWSMPMFYAFAYIFELTRYMSENVLLIVGFLIIMFVLAGGLILIVLYRTKFQRKVLPVYRNAYAYLLIITGFGIVGAVVMFLRFGGDARYVLHVLISLVMVCGLSLVEIGNRLFNIRIFKR